MPQVTSHRNPPLEAVTESENSPVPERLLVFVSLLILAIYFAVSAAPGLHAWFTQDDGGNLLNMHKYWEHSLWDVVGDCLRVVTVAYRPLGGVYYFMLYRLFGFNPEPFRAVALAFMLLNVFLAFGVLRRLSGSTPAALLGAVLMVNHPAVLDLLYSSGTIYEILCFLFYSLAIWCYFSWRESAHRAGSATLSWPRMAGVLVLTGCALDSKEMAMTLPAALLLIEFIYFPLPSWSVRKCFLFAWTQGRGALVMAALVVPAIAIKVLTPNPLSDDPRYAAHSLAGVVSAYRGYQSFLLYRHLRNPGLTALNLILLWIGMAALANALRSRAMKFGLAFLIVSLLPVCLIVPRNGYMVYIPLLGWALYIGALFQCVCDAVLRRYRLRPRMGAAVTLSALAAVAMPIAHLNAEQLAGPSNGYRQDGDDMRRMVERLRKVHPRLPHGSSLLVVDDPLPDGYFLLFMAQLAYADPSLRLDRIKMMSKPPTGDELLNYDFILGGGWELHDVRGIGDPRPPVDIRFVSAPSPAGGHSVAIPELAGKTVDLGIGVSASASANDRPERSILRNVVLDSSGRAELPESVPTGSTVRIEWVRPAGGNWISASGREPTFP
jgi:hypothetical protein